MEKIYIYLSITLLLLFIYLVRALNNLHLPMSKHNIYRYEYYFHCVNGLRYEDYFRCVNGLQSQTLFNKMKQPLFTQITLILTLKNNSISFHSGFRSCGFHGYFVNL